MIGVMCANLDPDKESILTFCIEAMGKVKHRLGVVPDLVQIPADADKLYEDALASYGITIERVPYLLPDHIYMVYG